MSRPALPSAPKRVAFARVERALAKKEEATCDHNDTASDES